MKEQIKTDIFSGFLGAGKTTLIKKLIKEAYAGEQVVLIENEFGEIGIDGGFLADAGVTINEINSGCICCSLVGDFGKALSQVIESYHPERIIIEPSGVGKLSDIIRAVENLGDDRLVLNSFAAVVDAKKGKMYMKNFGEFFNDQIEHASALILSHTAGLSQQKIDELVALLREHNASAAIVTTDWNALSGKDILAAMEQRDTMAEMLAKLAAETADDDDDDDECDDPDCECHHHHHDDDDDDDDEHEHEHEHHHHHHHHHHADDVFTSCGFETAHAFDETALAAMLEKLQDTAAYGNVLRAKGIVPCADGGAWLHFDYVPGEVDLRHGAAGVTGRLCVIGADLNEAALRELFGI